MYEEMYDRIAEIWFICPKCGAEKTDFTGECASCKKKEERGEEDNTQ
jgi:predicted ATP-dependent serine protease